MQEGQSKGPRFDQSSLEALTNQVSLTFSAAASGAAAGVCVHVHVRACCVCMHMNFRYVHASVTVTVPVAELLDAQLLCTNAIHFTHPT